MSQTRGRPRRASNPRTRSRSPRVKGDGGIMNEEEFLLKWNNHQTNFVDVFRELLGQSSFIDVSLVCGGEVFPAHKVILAACSPLLHNLFKENPCQHPVVILNDVPARDMKAMMKFIYQGEVSVSQTELASFLKTADNLQIKGLAEDREKDREREERKRKEKDSDAKSEGRVNKRQRTSDHNSNRELAMSQSNKAHKESYSSHNKNKSSSRSTSEDRICNSIAQYGIQPSVGIRTIPPPPHPTHPPTGNENDSSSANSQSVPPTSQAHSIPPKEETLMIKTEPFLDYHGEMVWQEGSEELDGNTQGPETINASEGLPLTDGHADSQVPAGMQEGQEGMPAPEMGEGGKYAEDMRGDANANNNEDPSQTAPATGIRVALEAGLRFVLQPSTRSPHKYEQFSASTAAGGGGGDGDEGEGGGETDGDGGGGSSDYVTLDNWRDAAQGLGFEQAAYDLHDASLSLLGVATPATRSKYRTGSGGSSRGGGRSSRYRRGSKTQAAGARAAAAAVATAGETALDGTVTGGGDRLEEMVMVHGECVAGDWRCKLCGLRFPKRSKLVRHFTRHTNVRQFSCPLCPGHYKRKDHLRHHMRTKHPISDVMSGTFVHYSG